MNKDRQVIGGLALAAATALITFSATKWAENSAETMERGEDAQIAEIVRGVIQEEMQTTINGRTLTHSEAFSSLAHNQAVMRTELGTVKDAVAALSED